MTNKRVSVKKLEFERENGMKKEKWGLRKIIIHGSAIGVVVHCRTCVP